ncbi:hypothetical protein O3M35_003252 [Rhynocoris fuscipes]|uniref:Uncharacterized protein n=1 Tax=Rhynocoris fuscipes TaxID=488301 RepID=A0AAW1CQ87_9HEMI
MKTKEIGHLVCVGAIIALVQAASKRQIGQGSSWTASWSWPAEGTNAYRNDLTHDSDYNQLSSTISDIKDHSYQNDGLTDEEIIDLLYSKRSSRLREINYDHPTLQERTTYTALFEPEIETRKFRDSQRQQSVEYPIITSYSHTIIH